MLRSLVGSEMCIRDRYQRRVRGSLRKPTMTTLPVIPSSRGSNRSGNRDAPSIPRRPSHLSHQAESLPALHPPHRRPSKLKTMTPRTTPGDSASTMSMSSPNNGLDSDGSIASFPSLSPVPPLKERRTENGTEGSCSEGSARNGVVSASRAVDVVPSASRGLGAVLAEAVIHADMGDFKMVRTVGIGTFGVVKLCELSNHPFVLKIMSKANVVAYKQKENTFAELKILSSINHPFIVRVYRSFTSQLCIYMLMQYVPGGELFSYLRKERTVSLRVAQFYTAQMVLALQYLGSKLIVYRDIKPENLLIDAQGYLTMTDFGFAKMLDPGGKTYTMCGTPEYMAPEVILRQPGYDQAVDWWAVGVLLYEMLVGRSPFQNPDPKKIYRGILRGKVDYEPVVDPTARDLIRRLLIRDPAKRGVYQKGELQTQSHKFFRGVDWDSLYLQEAETPWKPHVRADSHHGTG
eukprot:TRINITY_DN7568_c0_g2_i2.p1 TRINITY_DN7568_c0_g2~~TRINITY_DN7568_c0_g2_i2.p1  ORF type:complete len:462 (+),score=97.28 TRINITY_DN7568_c0_g2_i2:163-1548(+)